MSKKNRKAERITKKEDYLNLFPGDKKSEKERMRSRALSESQDIRKFEINLYWKRTGFFWAFITVIYAALFAVFCEYINCPSKYSVFVPVISVLSGLGFFFSVAWHMVNKGSKFWQKNWETHVSLLEKSEIGPLYDVYLNPKGTKSERWWPTSAFDFSVTKINMWASFIMVICSLGGVIGVDVWLIREQNEGWCFVLVPSFLILFFCICLALNCDGNNDLCMSNSDQDELNMVQIK